jgi:glycosyltransferase involved in cell wall biosynthesis
MSELEGHPRRFLFVAYYFPPESSSGVHRALNFARHLPDHGWLPTVLTVEPNAYPPDSILDLDLLARLDPRVQVLRTRVLGRTSERRLLGRIPDTGRPSEVKPVPVGLVRRLKSRVRPWLLIPDDKLGWLAPAVMAGWKAIRAEPHHAIVATGGPWTGFLVGWLLARLTGLPLVLDYRDPWTANPYRSSHPVARHRIERALERRVLATARAVVANTDELEELLSSFAPSRRRGICTITNGFDSDVFASIPQFHRSPNGPLTIVHTGHVYRHRTPEGLFRALRGLLDADEVNTESLRVVFVGEADLDLAELVRRYNLGTVVELRSQVRHHDALRTMCAADVLLLIQSGTQLQIPAKVYEYMGAAKPILALTDSNAIRRLITANSLGSVCLPDDVPGIQAAVRSLLKGNHEFSAAASKTFRAEAIAARLAKVLSEVSDQSVVARNSLNARDISVGGV